MLVALMTLVLAGACGTNDNELILATTTSTENSGLLEVVIPAFESETGVSVKVIPVGSGAAMRMGERGDADVLLVHSPEAERRFVADGFGLERERVMHNDFVIAGPPEDPAAIAGSSDVAAALAAIAGSESAFVSRGDDSGTHARELSLWSAAGLSAPAGASWYAESGQGMSATLTIAAERSAYVLSDRGTWLAVADPTRLPIVVEDDEALLNVYHVIVVNPEVHRDVNDGAARSFSRFLREDATQELIAGFGIERFGQPLFFASAHAPE
jgi:tungstate transport system substrate-binding protein